MDDGIAWHLHACRTSAERAAHLSRQLTFERRTTLQAGKAPFAIILVLRLPSGIATISCLVGMEGIVPGIGTGGMPANATGYCTMVDQALDLGLLVPLFILVGSLLLKREKLGFLLSASTPILAMTVGLSVVAGELMPGLPTGRTNKTGLGVFSLFFIAALALLVKALASLR